MASAVESESAKRARPALAILLGLIAVNALGGGCYGLAGAPAIPRVWLAHSPFRDYFVPSFVLLVVVGGSCAVAAVAVLARADLARRAAAAAGLILLGWISTQLAVLGYVSWLQPTMALAGLAIVALARRLPRLAAPPELERRRSFSSYYFGLLLRPRATFEALLLDARRLRLGGLALFSSAALYTLVYLFLVMGGGRPTVFKPWLAIPAQAYYHWDVFLLGPSMFMGWVLAAGLVQLVAKRVGPGRGSFEDNLSTLGFGIALASWATLAHDLVTSFLGAFGVMDQRAYEDAMSSATPFHTLIWLLMGVYLVAFLLLFTQATRAAQRVRTPAAALLAGCAFVAYQGVFLLFNR